jgi:hypothetical protein
MSVAVAVMTDGRDDCLAQTIASFEALVDGPISERYIHDDVGDQAHVDKLAGLYPNWTILSSGRRLGFGGAYRSVWSYLANFSTASWVAGWEDDFVLTRPVDLSDMIALAQAQPHLAQVALRRQAVGHEIPYGGFMEQAPGWYTERSDGERVWVETARNFTTNPSLYRRALCSVGWPEGANSEGLIGFHLREHGLPWGIPGDDVRFGFLGSMESGREWIRHIGDVRVGTGY